MKPCIPSPSCAGVLTQQVLHGPWPNPNGNIAPGTPGNGAVYSQDGVVPANAWFWDVDNQIWVQQGGTGAADYIGYAGPPNVNPPLLANIVVDVNGRQWQFFNNQWN